MTVQILISTYNGSVYLDSLLKSLLAQTYPHVEILVRDDGSSDSTVHLLRQYTTTCKTIKVVYGKNLGFVHSFLDLLKLSSSTTDYLAFCDQDDVWLPDKVSRAIEYLSQCSPKVPALYCSRVTVVDKDLKPLGYSENPPKGLLFPNALVQNPVRGCTFVFNQAARQLFREFPEFANGHDSWVYLVVSAFGTVFYDKQPRILYGQHTKNICGIRLGVINIWKEKVHRFFNI